MAERGSRRLNSWKEIAAYVERDVRTLARWEKDRGMPVRRVPGARGQVFAYTDEIDDWLKSPAGGTPLDAASSPAHPPPGLAEPVLSPPAAVARNRRLPIGPVVIAALALVTLVTAAPRLWRDPRPIVELRTERNDLVAFTASGEAWRHTFGDRVDLGAPGFRWISADVDGDSAAEIVTVASLARTTLPTDRLVVFEPDGRVRWERELTDAVTFGGVPYHAPWSTGRIHVSGRGRAARILWLTHHHTWWPSIATVFDGDGTLHGRFVHAGWITGGMLTADGGAVLAGTSNHFGADVIIALDRQSWDGAGPPLPGQFECNDCPAGRPLRYFVLPKPELNAAATLTQPQINVFEASIEVHFVQTEPDTPSPAGNADIIYELSSDLQLRRARPSDAYWAWHRELEKAGRLTHTADACPDRQPAAVRVWNRGAGWSEMRVAR